MFLNERTTSGGRWIAAIETLTARKQRDYDLKETLVGERGEEPGSDALHERLSQLAQQATAAIEAFEQSRQTIETQGQEVYEDPGDTVSIAQKARGDYRAARGALLGFECGLVTGNDDIEIAVENLLARPPEAVEALELARDMKRKAAIVAEDATLTRTAPTEGNEREAEALDDHAARLIGYAAIAENALEALIADHPEAGANNGERNQ